MITAEQFLFVCGFGAFWGALFVGASYLIGKLIGVFIQMVIDLLRKNKSE